VRVLLSKAFVTAVLEKGIEIAIKNMTFARDSVQLYKKADELKMVDIMQRIEQDLSASESDYQTWKVIRKDAEKAGCKNLVWLCNEKMAEVAITFEELDFLPFTDREYLYRMLKEAKTSYQFKRVCIRCDGEVAPYFRAVSGMIKYALTCDDWLGVRSIVSNSHKYYEKSLSKAYAAAKDNLDYSNVLEANIRKNNPLWNDTLAKLIETSTEAADLNIVFENCEVGSDIEKSAIEKAKSLIRRLDDAIMALT